MNKNEQKANKNKRERESKKERREMCVRTGLLHEPQLGTVFE